jgi:cyclase
MVEEVARGVFAYVQPDGGWCLNNAGILVGGAETALVDTVATHERALALKRAAAAVAPRPLRYVVNTHFHGDHTYGNFVFAPDTAIIGHEACRAEMAAAGLAMTALWPDVQWGDVTVTPPSVTFSDRAVLHLGDLEVQLIHPGPAHTTGDTVVWLPEPRVLFTGDIVMSGVTPFIPMGSLSGSLAAIGLMRELDPHTVVPGHGPVGGPELLDANALYLQWLRDVAEEAWQAGLTPLEAARATNPGRFASLLDPERLVPNLHRAYAEAAGAAPGEPLDIMALFGEMVDFHGGLPACHA